jgi:hypothetical protein
VCLKRRQRVHAQSSFGIGKNLSTPCPSQAPARITERSRVYCNNARRTCLQQRRRVAVYMHKTLDVMIGKEKGTEYLFFFRSFFFSLTLSHFPEEKCKGEKSSCLLVSSTPRNPHPPPPTTPLLPGSASYIHVIRGAESSELKGLEKTCDRWARKRQD